MTTRRVALGNLLVAVAVPVGLALFFWVVRDVPDVPSCEPLSQTIQAQIDEHNSGAAPSHVAGGLLVASAIAFLSLIGRRDSAGRMRPGGPTVVALVVYCGYLASVAADQDVREAGLILGWLGIITVPLATALALIAAVLLWRDRSVWGPRFTLAAAWVVAFAIIPGHLGLILTMDEPLCMS